MARNEILMNLFRFSLPLMAQRFEPLWKQAQKKETLSETLKQDDGGRVDPWQGHYGPFAPLTLAESRLRSPRRAGEGSIFTESCMRPPRGKSCWGWVIGFRPKGPCFKDYGCQSRTAGGVSHTPTYAAVKRRGQFKVCAHKPFVYALMMLK